MYGTGARPLTPPPNRYGLFFDTAGASDTEDDAYSVSSSSGEDEDGDENIGGTRTEEVPNDEQLTFTSPIVYGFSFSDKRWRKL